MTSFYLNAEVISRPRLEPLDVVVPGRATVTEGKSQLVGGDLVVGGGGGGVVGQRTGARALGHARMRSHFDAVVGDGRAVVGRLVPHERHRVGGPIGRLRLARRIRYSSPALGLKRLRPRSKLFLTIKKIGTVHN